MNFQKYLLNYNKTDAYNKNFINYIKTHKIFKTPYNIKNKIINNKKFNYHKIKKYIQSNDIVISKSNCIKKFNKF